MDPKECIDDDVYKDLKASLLRTGKGRPKALKDMHINNKLLVQLAYLKEEGGTHWKAVDKWMEQLAPDVSHDCVTSTHFFNMVDSARNTFLKLFPDRHEDFLAQRVDLDFISSILSSFGITKTNIGTIPKEPVLPQDLPNQFVLDLEQFRTSQNLPKKLTFSWINFFTLIYSRSITCIFMTILNVTIFVPKNVFSDFFQIMYFWHLL